MHQQLEHHIRYAAWQMQAKRNYTTNLSIPDINSYGEDYEKDNDVACVDRKL